MEEKSLKLTQGALITAVFGVLMFLNRQTGTLLEGLLMYVIPLPLAIYGAKYGLGASAPVMAAMSMLAFLLSTPASAISAVMELLIGLVFGICLYRRADPGKTLLAVMLMSVTVVLFDLFIISMLFGMDINAQSLEMQKALTEAAQKQGIAIPEELLGVNYMKRILIISMGIAGAIQGFIIYTVGLLLMRRLGMHVQKPRSIYELHPPAWTAWAAAICYFGYGISMGRGGEESFAQMILMMLGMIGSMFLILFGYLAGNLLLRRMIPEHRFICALLSFLLCFMVPPLAMIVGFMYITGIGMHA